IIGEMVGGWLVIEKLKQSIESGEIKLGSDEYNKLLNTIKITAGAIALLYDFDVDTAANEALVAVENNALVKSDDIKTFICIIIHFAPLDLQQLAMQSYINGNMSAMNMLA
ncbi:VENN motif pre-toxin domain-containing protein, partial [Moraxella catarrhalis]|uniref:VENN motif pre-toxin domain-containing protein n=1 Tax=Moraxella catarrhalis TaxID=480 RepID=UPI001D0DA978